MKQIYERLSRDGGIFVRNVVPSLFVGTRGVLSSLAAYAFCHDDADKAKVRRVREVMTMGADGAQLVLDWELPPSMQHSTNTNKVEIISKPVVLLVHGMNNDSTFGYIRSMMRTATGRGWVAVCMNLRGQDGEGVVKNSTPRGVSSLMCMIAYLF